MSIAGFLAPFITANLIFVGFLTRNKLEHSSSSGNTTQLPEKRSIASLSTTTNASSGKENENSSSKSSPSPAAQCSIDPLTSISRNLGSSYGSYNPSSSNERTSQSSYQSKKDKAKKKEALNKQRKKKEGKSKSKKKGT